MNRDNDLLRAAEAHIAYCEEVSRGMDDAVALIAFALLCLLLYVALHVGVV